jgi:exodeoxyribonuclease VII small subunit
VSSSQATYRGNIEELEGIVKSIEAGDVDLDVLATRVERAKAVIQECRRRLRTTRESVERIMAQVDDEPYQDDESLEDGPPDGLDANEESLFGTCPPEPSDEDERDFDV